MPELEVARIAYIRAASELSDDELRRRLALEGFPAGEGATKETLAEWLWGVVGFSYHLASLEPVCYPVIRTSGSSLGYTVSHITAAGDLVTRTFRGLRPARFYATELRKGGFRVDGPTPLPEA